MGDLSGLRTTAKRSQLPLASGDWVGLPLPVYDLDVSLSGKSEPGPRCTEHCAMVLPFASLAFPSVLICCPSPDLSAVGFPSVKPFSPASHSHVSSVPPLCGGPCS